MASTPTEALKKIFEFNLTLYIKRKPINKQLENMLGAKLDSEKLVNKNNFEKKILHF